MNKGRLITFEGIDGVGKTTHAHLAAEFLTARGLVVRQYREPGGTPLGEQLRQLLKAGTAQSALGELLMFATARAELVQQQLKPELATGEYIVLDRFTDSTLAYQGALETIPESTLVAVCLAAAGGLYPDLTLWLDISPEEATRRRFPLTGGLEDSEASGARDAIERRSTQYFARVRERYVAIYHSDRERVVQIDAGGSVEETSAHVLQALTARLEQWLAADRLGAQGG